MSDPPWAPWRWPDEPECTVRTGPGAVAPGRGARECAGRFPRHGHGSGPDPAPAARLGHLVPGPTVGPGSRHDAARGRSRAARRWGGGGGLGTGAAGGRPAGACPIVRCRRHGIAGRDVPRPERTGGTIGRFDRLPGHESDRSLDSRRDDEHRLARAAPPCGSSMAACSWRATDGTRAPPPRPPPSCTTRPAGPGHPPGRCSIPSTSSRPRCCATARCWWVTSPTATRTTQASAPSCTTRLPGPGPRRGGWRLWER